MICRNCGWGKQAHIGPNKDICPNKKPTRWEPSSAPASQEPKSIDELAQAEMAEGIYDITEAETPRPEMPPEPSTLRGILLWCGAKDPDDPFLQEGLERMISRFSVAAVPQEALRFFVKREGDHKYYPITLPAGTEWKVLNFGDESVAVPSQIYRLLKSPAAPRTQPLLEHRYKKYDLRSGCTCGWGTTLCSDEEGYAQWAEHIAQFFLPTPPEQGQPEEHK
jgi:hypothetical protein